MVDVAQASDNGTCTPSQEHAEWAAEQTDNQADEAPSCRALADRRVRSLRQVQVSVLLAFRDEC